MTINEGIWDRTIRIVIGLALGYVSWSAWPVDANFLSMAGAVSFISLVIGIVAFVTGVVGYCPLYQVFGVTTNKRLHA
jgi:hypothetical protein